MLSPGATNRTYSTQEIAQMSGFTVRQIGYWAKQGIVVPSIQQAHGSGTRRRYSFDDFLQLRFVRQLMSYGWSIQKIREAIMKLRKVMDDPHVLQRAIPLSHPFFIDYAQAKTILYPNELEESRKSKKASEDKEHILAGLKVLVPYSTSPTWGKRIRSSIERNGYYVSGDFYAIILSSLAQEKYITHEVLAAVLDWDVSNAWMYCSLYARMDATS